MSTKKIVTFISLGALALAAVFGVVTYRTVLAAAPANTFLANSQAASSYASYLSTNFNLNMGPRGGFTDQQLADALGITVDKLTAAYTTATDNALSQAVTAGLITQSQADALKARGGRFGESEAFTANGIDYNALLAQALGITADQLKAGYVKAFSTAVDSAVTSGSMTQAQADLAKARFAIENSTAFATSMQTAYKAALDQAVKDGTITQAQEDALLQSQNQKPILGLGGMKGYGGPEGFGFGGGRGHGFGGPRGGVPGTNNGQGNNNNQTPAQPTPAPSSSTGL
jgi:outer membrane lipoprotein SlyB